MLHIPGDLKFAFALKNILNLKIFKTTNLLKILFSIIKVSKQTELMFSLFD